LLYEVARTKQTSCVQSIDIQLQLQFTYALHDETYLLTEQHGTKYIKRDM